MTSSTPRPRKESSRGYSSSESSNKQGLAIEIVRGLSQTRGKGEREEKTVQLVAEGSGRSR